MNSIEWEAASAFLLGRDLGELCAPRHREMVGEFLRVVHEPDSQPFQLMVELGPYALRCDASILEQQLAALAAGLPAAGA